MEEEIIVNGEQAEEQDQTEETQEQTSASEQSPEQTQQTDDLDSRLDKHPRFQEVYKKMKEYESKLAEFEKKSAPPASEDPDVALLTSWGFDKERAKSLLKILETRAEKKFAPIQEQTRTQQIKSGFNDFFSSHSEIDEKVVGEMEKLFDALPKEVQRIYASDLNSLDMLLAKAEKNLGSNYQKGKTDAISQSQKKRDGGSISGRSGGPTELTEESINNMDTKEFNTREKEILKKVREIESEES